MKPPTLSLAMIVKNEEENLVNCLISVAGHVDEIIIVDTGSKDRTREVATRFGASVYTFDHRTHPEAFFVDDEAHGRMVGAPPPYSGEISFADFGAARAFSFAQATCDFILWVDADDVVKGAENLRACVADLAARGLDFGFLTYDYATDGAGRVMYRQSRERIVRRGSANWVNPVHEVLLPHRPVVPVRYENVVISHRRKADRVQMPNRNYKILLRELRKRKLAQPDAPIDPRTWFYLGQEARFVEPVKAVGFYEEYLKSSGWPEERAAAHVALGHIYEFGMVGLPEKEAYQRANREYATAAAEMPGNPDGFFGLARIADLRQRWGDCVDYSERGFKIGNTDSMLGMNPLDRTYRPHVYYNHALSMLGRIEEAAASCRAALAICPDDPGVPGGASGMLAFNLKIYEEQMQKKPEEKALASFDKFEDLETAPAVVPQDVLIIWAMQLWKNVVACGDGVRALALLEGLPSVISTDPVIEKMRAATLRRFPKAGDLPTGSRKFPEFFVPPVGIKPPNGRLSAQALSVVIWTGPAFEPWDPTTPNTKGIGGSETACVEMAKHLAKLGHNVVVYGDCAQREGKYDEGNCRWPNPEVIEGLVEYRHWQKFDGADCDVFIASRAPGISDFGDRIKAKLRLLWVHDIHVGAPSAQMECWLLRFDRILCLSEWHKGFFLSQYPTVHPDRVVVTRNGIDPGRFRVVVAQGKDPRNQVVSEHMPEKRNNLVWSSSPNRGLPDLLDMMPQIRRRVPDVQLHIYYGFDCWETIAKQRNDPRELEEIQWFKDKIADAVNSGGVFNHGRVGQHTLAQAFMNAKVWAYPTSFPETSCISAMEAQAAGCVPVTTRVAALVETVKHGITIEPGAQEGRYRFVEHVCTLLEDRGNMRAELAHAGRKWALENLSWQALAADWQEMFNRLIGEVAANPIPLWRSV